MKYIALKKTTYSRGGPGYEDENGNWHGELVERGQEVSVAHLNESQIEMLVGMGVLAEQPDLPEVKRPSRPAKKETQAAEQAAEPTEPNEPLDTIQENEQ